MRECQPQFLLDLLDGLELVDDSLYREWMLNHPNPDAASTGRKDEGMRLSYHGYTQETMLLADMRNMMAAIINSKLDPKESKTKQVDPILFPGDKTGGEKRSNASSLNAMTAMFSKFSHKHEA